MIGIASATVAPGGALVLPGAEAKSGLWDRTRRVTRTATLDGGAVLLDQGYSVADRTLSIVVEGASLAQIEALSAMVELYPLVTVATREGVFVAALSQSVYTSGALTVTALVTSKRSA